MLGVVRFPGLHESQNGVEFSKFFRVVVRLRLKTIGSLQVDGLMHNTNFLDLVRTCRGFPIYINLHVPWKIPVDDGIGSPKMMVTTMVFLWLKECHKP
jgi:hypothetical protein